MPASSRAGNNVGVGNGPEGKFNGGSNLYTRERNSTPHFFVDVELPLEQVGLRPSTLAGRQVAHSEVGKCLGQVVAVVAEDAAQVLDGARRQTQFRPDVRHGCLSGQAVAHQRQERFMRGSPPHTLPWTVHLELPGNHDRTRHFFPEVSQDGVTLGPTRQDDEHIGRRAIAIAVNYLATAYAVHRLDD